MSSRLRIPGQVLFVAVLAFALAPQAVGQDTILFATDFTKSKIVAVDVSTPSAPPVTVTPTTGKPDSLIFAPNGDIIYTTTLTGNLWRWDGTTNTMINTSSLGTPGDLTLEPSGTSVLVSNVDGPPAASVLRVDLITGKVTTLFQLPLQFTRFDGITYDNNGNLFVVANFDQVLQISPSIPNKIINQSPVITCNPGTTCLDGMTFDPVYGELWISYYYSGGIVSITPTNLPAGFSSPFATNIPYPDGLEADGKGNIYVAATETNVWLYNIASGNPPTKLNAVEGLDDLAPQTGSGSRPTGYVEICKQGDPNYMPPNQTYDFTVTAPFFSVGPIQVPLGECSGPIQVPAATPPNFDTITEKPVAGVLVDDVTAIAYNIQGIKMNELDMWTEPDLNATVYVQPGDQSLETLATFTNYMAGNGLVKICKIAGTPAFEGKTFEFFEAWGFLQFNIYLIQAGPPEQGGYCTVANSLPVNTPVKLSESRGYGPAHTVSNITVDCNACTYSLNLPQAVASFSVGAGITEVSFTDIPKVFYTNLGPSGNPYQCSGNLNSGWPVSGSAAPLGSVTQADEFTSQISGSISQIDVAVSPFSNSYSSLFNVSLYTNSGGQPGTQLGQWTGLSAAACPGLVSITGISGLNLTVGQQYWLVVGPNISTTYDYWNLNNQGVTGSSLYSNNGGSSWNSNGGNSTLGAFDVLP